MRSPLEKQDLNSYRPSDDNDSTHEEMHKDTPKPKLTLILRIKPILTLHFEPIIHQTDPNRHSTNISCLDPFQFHRPDHLRRRGDCRSWSHHRSRDSNNNPRRSNEQDDNTNDEIIRTKAKNIVLDKTQNFEIPLR